MTDESVALPRLWLNGYAYATRILRGGDDAWNRPNEMGLFCREAANLLSLDLIDVDTDSLFRSARSGDGDQAGEADDLEALFEDDDPRAAVGEALGAVAGTIPFHPIALSVPGVVKLARDVVRCGALDADQMDDAAVAMTDFIRDVVSERVAAVMVREPNTDALPFYAPLANVCGHLGCPLVLAVDDGGDLPAGASVFRTVYAPAPRSGAEGHRLDPAFWTAVAPARLMPAEPVAVFAEVPADAVPETVQERLALLRAAG